MRYGLIMSLRRTKYKACVLKSQLIAASQTKRFCNDQDERFFYLRTVAEIVKVKCYEKTWKMFYTDETCPISE